MGITTAERIQPVPDTGRNIMDDFRRWGYLQAKLDPLDQYLQPQILPELEVRGPLADKARNL
jgi:2-oxoglutarate dehydrogenase E1 component